MFLFAILFSVHSLFTSGAYAATSNSCTSSHEIQAGFTGSEVQALQVFLNQNPQTQLAATGVGSPGKETTFFGTLTYNALARFQAIHKGGAPSSIDGGSGIKLLLLSKANAVVVCSGSAINSTPTLTPTPIPTLTAPLTIGSTNPQVSLLQGVLKTLGFFQHEVTGYFGPITRRAVIGFQQSKGIINSGFVGPITRNAINIIISAFEPKSKVASTSKPYPKTVTHKATTTTKSSSGRGAADGSVAHVDSYSGDGTVADTTAPTAAITYSTSNPVKSGASLTITATFSEAMADSPVPKIAISGANTVAATAMTKVSSTVYTYVDTVGSGDGTATVALSIGTDLATNVVTGTPTSGSTFTVDNTSPVVSSISSGTPGTATATITWTTNETADSQVEYGTTTSYGTSTTLVSSLVTSHSVGLSSLTSSTTYHYRVHSTDAAGNATVSSDQTLTTTAGYVPGAVTFNPETMLGVVGSTLGANGGVDTSHFIASFWLRSSIGSSTNTGNDALWSSWLLDIWTNLGDGLCNSETCPGLDFVTDNAASTFGTMRLNSNDSTGGTNHSLSGVINNYFATRNATWHHWLWVADTGYANGSKRQALYLDGTKQTLSSSTEVGSVGSFNIALNSALGFALNGHTNSGINSGAFDISDFVLDTHTTSISGCGTVIDSSSNVCSQVVSAFYNAGPVALSTNCAGPLGTQPELCFSGDKTSFGTNKGNATATIALSNPTSGSSQTAALYNASYPPANAPTTRPYFNWVAANHLTGLVAGTASMATNNRGNPIAAGDLILLSVGLGDTSGTTDRAIQTPAGFTLLTTTTAVLPSYTTSGTHPMNTAVFYKIATAGDVTAAGSDWASSPTINWTANGTALRWASYTMLNYKGANGTTPVQIADAAYAINTSTSSVAPAVTVTSAPATLVTVNTFWSCTPVTTIATTEDLRFRRTQSAGCTFGYPEVGDQAIASTGSTGTRTTTQSSAESSMAVNIVLQP